MIIGIGCDIINIKRIEKSAEFLEHFKQKILGPDELAEAAQKNLPTERDTACLLAKYYAAKEAFAKALGTGFINGIFLRDIQILHNDSGKPVLHISGVAAKYLHTLTEVPLLHITLSDDYPFAQAVVIIEK